MTVHSPPLVRTVRSRRVAYLRVAQELLSPAFNDKGVFDPVKAAGILHFPASAKIVGISAHVCWDTNRFMLRVEDPGFPADMGPGPVPMVKAVFEKRGEEVVCTTWEVEYEADPEEFYK